MPVVNNKSPACQQAFFPFLFFRFSFNFAHHKHTLCFHRFSTSNHRQSATMSDEELFDDDFSETYVSEGEDDAAILMGTCPERRRVVFHFHA